MRSSKRILVVAAVVALFGALSAVAIAASPHCEKGGEPVCTVTQSGSSASTRCSASLSGLGGGDLNIDGNTAPGQNRVLVGPVTAPTTIPADQIKNGKVSFTTNPAVLTAPTTVTGAEAGCPNPNWTGVNPTLRVTNITLTIEQGGTLLFTCTASNSNGLSGRVPLSCS
jgi:hypothetical protein